MDDARTSCCPPHWSHNNPIDILGDAGAERYAKALEIAAADPNSDGLLVILTPQAMTDPTQTAEALKPYAHSDGKPVLASWMGGADVAAGEAILNQREHPDLPLSRHRRARLHLHVAATATTCAALYETPALPADPSDGVGPRSACSEHHRSGARRRAARSSPSSNRSSCSPPTAFPTVETRIARDARTKRWHARRQSAIRSCSSSIPRPSRTRPTWAACS